MCVWWTGKFSSFLVLSLEMSLLSLPLLSISLSLHPQNDNIIVIVKFIVKIIWMIFGLSIKMIMMIFGWSIKMIMIIFAATQCALSALENFGGEKSQSGRHILSWKHHNHHESIIIIMKALWTHHNHNHHHERIISHHNHHHHPHSKASQSS